MQFFNRIALLAGVVLLVGCIESGGKGKGKGNGVTGAPVTVSDFFLKLKIKGAKNFKANGNDEAVGLAKSSYLYKMKVDKTLEQIQFTVEDKTTGETYDVALPVLAMKDLSKRYTAIKFSANKTGILDADIGEIYDLEYANYDEMQVRGSNLYYLNSKQLYSCDLAAAELEATPVNNQNVLTSNTSNPTGIFSMHNNSSSPFRFLGFNQVGTVSDFASPSFVFLDNSMMAAVSGPSGGSRVTLFQEGTDYSYDCQIGADSLFTNVAGGLSGGVIQTANDDLYQIQIGNSLNCGLPGVFGCGDRLELVTFNTAGNCVSYQTIVDLGPVSKFGVGSQISHRTNYRLQDEERYVLNPNGFLKTESDGFGGLTMGWVNLDLSAIPLSDSSRVLVDNDTVYYRVGGTVYYQNLQAGSTPAVFYSGASVASFNVVDGALHFTNSSGQAFVVDFPGAAAVAQNVSGVNLENSVVKF